MAWNEFVGERKTFEKKNKLLDSKKFILVTNVLAEGAGLRKTTMVENENTITTHLCGVPVWLNCRCIVRIESNRKTKKFLFSVHSCCLLCALRCI